MRQKRWFLIPLLLAVVYTVSIVWRVSVAEMAQFGKTDLLPLPGQGYRYGSHPLKPKEAFGSGVYRMKTGDRSLLVWRQKINGFQHLYGSALASFELGDKPADWLFCANEHVEAFFDFLVDAHGIETSDLRDRRKDLFHNQTGRRIGQEVRRSGLRGQDADRALQQAVLIQMEHGVGYIAHYKDPRVDKLPSEAALGCPFLPPVGALFARGSR